MEIIKVSKQINMLRMKLKYNHFNMSMEEINKMKIKINDLCLLANNTNIKYLKLKGV